MINEAFPGGERGRGVPVPLEKMALFPCSPKTKSWFSIFPVPQNCLCSPVPLMFRPLFPCSPENIACSLRNNDIVSLFLKNCPSSPVPQNLGRASLTRRCSALNRLSPPGSRLARFTCQPCQVVFLGDLPFSPTYRLTWLKMSEIILTDHKTQILTFGKKSSSLKPKHFFF